MVKCCNDRLSESTNGGVRRQRKMWSATNDYHGLFQLVKIVYTHEYFEFVKSIFQYHLAISVQGGHAYIYMVRWGSNTNLQLVLHGI